MIYVNAFLSFRDFIIGMKQPPHDEFLVNINNFITLDFPVQLPFDLCSWERIKSVCIKPTSQLENEIWIYSYFSI